MSIKHTLIFNALMVAVCLLNIPFIHWLNNSGWLVPVMVWSSVASAVIYTVLSGIILWNNYKTAKVWHER